MDSNARDWCGLVSDLLKKIAFCLETESDVHRFRSVCHSWRDSAAPPPPPRASRILHLPSYPRHDDPHGDNLELAESTMYYIEPLSDATTARRPPWFVMLRWFSEGRGSSSSSSSTPTAKYIDMATGRPMREAEARSLPKVLDLRYHQVLEVCSVHFLGPDRDPFYAVSICCSEITTRGGGGFMVMILGRRGILYVWKAGDDEWTSLHNTVEGPAYLGVVGYHKGKFYVVSSTGRTLTVDPVSLEMKQVVPGRGTNGAAIGSWRRERKENLVVESRYLVESSSGDLLVVDKCVPKVPDGEGLVQRRDLGFEFAVRKLDEQRQGWIPEEDGLGDKVLFIAYAWFGLAHAKHLPGYTPNCVYFVDDDLRGCRQHPASCFMVCQVAGGREEPQEALRFCVSSHCSNLYWTLPIWLGSAVRCMELLFGRR